MAWKPLPAAGKVWLLTRKTSQASGKLFLRAGKVFRVGGKTKKRGRATRRAPGKVSQSGLDYWVAGGLGVTGTAGVVPVVVDGLTAAAAFLVRPRNGLTPSSTSFSLRLP